MSDASSSASAPATSASWLQRRLGRVTAGGRFIPLIDGLRFVAISAVVFYHLNDYLVHKRNWTDSTAVRETWLYQVLNVGGCGVPLFFAISGFILGLPFLEKIQEQRPFDLRAYFLRRVTRLEPPYVINLLLITVLLVAVKGAPLAELAGPLAASLLYVHNLVYGEMSRINFVAWSLEIEVQFYLLAPLLAWMLYCPPRHVRRLVITLIILGTAYARSQFTGPVPPRVGLSLLGVYEHFLVGMLLADVYHTDWKRSPITNVLSDLLGVAAWWGVLAVNWSAAARPWLPVVTFLAYYFTFRGAILSSILSRPLIATIGGMCYTIYLYHFFVISLAGRAGLQLTDGLAYPTQFTVLAAVAIPVMLVTCSILFAAFEKPFMIWRPFASRLLTPHPRPAFPATAEATNLPGLSGRS